MDQRCQVLEGNAPGSRKSLWVIGSLIVGLFLALAYRYFGHTADDAFISFRYARNLAEGFGPVFNIGERVEGYTNFLWVVLIALGLKLNLDPEQFSRWLGLVASVGTIVVLVYYGRRVFRSNSWAVWIAPAFFALHPAVAVWATAGLETPLFACLVTWAVLMTAVGLEHGHFPWPGAVLMGLAALTRPEGAALALLLALVTLLFAVRRKSLFRGWLVWAGVFMAIWAPYFLWRWNYYGYVFPNSFYAKVDPGGSGVIGGFEYTHAFLQGTGYWLLPLFIGLAFHPGRRVVTIVAMLIVAQFLYVIFIGGDGLPMFRFFMPGLGLLFFLLGAGVEGLGIRIRPRVAMVWAVAGALLLAGGWLARPHFTGLGLEYVRQEIREVAAWKEIGLWFRQEASRSDSLAVLPAGAIPYFSQLESLDMLGLNDVTIAHTSVPMGRMQAGHEKYNLEYVLRKSPTYILVGVYRLLPEPATLAEHVQPYYQIEYALLNSDEFRRSYRPMIARTAKGYFVFFMRSMDAG